MVRLAPLLLSCITCVRSTITEDDILDGIQALLDADAILSGTSGSSSVPEHHLPISAAEEETITGPPPSNTPVGLVGLGRRSVVKRSRDGVEKTTVDGANGEQGVLHSGPKRLRAGGEEAPGAVSTAGVEAHHRIDMVRVAHRRKIIKDFLIANNKIRDRETFPRLREILRDDPIANKTLKHTIAAVSRELGMSIRPRTTWVEKMPTSVLRSHRAPGERYTSLDGDVVRAGTPLPLVQRGCDAEEDFFSVAPPAVSPANASDNVVVTDGQDLETATTFSASKPPRASSGDKWLSNHSKTNKRLTIIRDYLRSVDGVRDSETINRIEAALSSVGVKVARSTLREDINEMCHRLGYPVAGHGGESLGTRRSAIVKEFIKANPDMVNPELIEGIYAALIPHGLDNVLPRSLDDLIRKARRRLLGEGGSSPEGNSGSEEEQTSTLNELLSLPNWLGLPDSQKRRMIIKAILRDSTRAGTARELYEKIESALEDAKVPRITPKKLREYIAEVHRALNGPVPENKVDHGTPGRRRSALIESYLMANPYQRNSELIKGLRALLISQGLDGVAPGTLSDLIRTVRLRLEHVGPTTSSETPVESPLSDDAHVGADADDEVETLHESANARPVGSALGPIPSAGRPTAIQSSEADETGIPASKSFATESD